MADRVDTYSARGFVRTLAFSLAVMAVSATVLYLTAPERLICERAADGEVVCGLTRTMMALTVRTLRLGSVRGAAVKTSEPVPVFGFGASLVPLWVVGYLFPGTRPKGRR